MMDILNMCILDGMDCYMMLSVAAETRLRNSERARTNISWIIVLICWCLSRVYKVEARSVEHMKNVARGLENKIIELQQKLTEKVNVLWL